jgi:molecular chaperone GrpE
MQNNNQNQEQIVDEQILNPEAENIQDEMGNSAQEIPEEMTDKSNEYQLRYEDLQNRYLRVLADFENYKREVLTQKSQDERKIKKQIITTAILPLLDHLKLAVDYAPKTENPALIKYLESVENILKSSFLDIKKIGAEVIIPVIGDLFDQNTMEAIQVVPTPANFAAHSVVNIVSFGLKINEIVIQPARVIICE